jgi:hypothetical protein
MVFITNKKTNSKNQQRHASRKTNSENPPKHQKEKKEF